MRRCRTIWRLTSGRTSPRCWSSNKPGLTSFEIRSIRSHTERIRAAFFATAGLCAVALVGLITLFKEALALGSETAFAQVKEWLTEPVDAVQLVAAVRRQVERALGDAVSSRSG